MTAGLTANASQVDENGDSEDAFAQTFFDDDALALSSRYADLESAGAFNVGHLINIHAVPNDAKLSGTDYGLVQRFANSGLTLKDFLEQPYAGHGIVPIEISSLLPRRSEEDVTRLTAAHDARVAAYSAFRNAEVALFGGDYHHLPQETQNVLLQTVRHNLQTGSIISIDEIRWQKASKDFHAACAAETDVERSLAGEETDDVVFIERLMAPTVAEILQAASRLLGQMMDEHHRRSCQRSIYFEGIEQKEGSAGFDVMWGT